MRVIFSVVFFLAFMASHGISQNKVMHQTIIYFNEAKFKTGNEELWKDQKFNDSDWKTIKTTSSWEGQGYSGYDGFGWYRIHFDLPAKMLEDACFKEIVSFNLATIDDVDEAFLNGVSIGKTGNFPGDALPYQSAWNSIRLYNIPVRHPALRWNEENVLAIKVYDGSSNGGMTGYVPSVRVLDLPDLLVSEVSFEGNTASVTLANHADFLLQGKLSIELADRTGKPGEEIISEQISLLPAGKIEKMVVCSNNSQSLMVMSFTESQSGKTLKRYVNFPYILTPKPSEEPRINGAKIFGIRPGSPFLFKIAATGKKPLAYSVADLPDGLKVDKNSGIITGTLSKEATFHCKIQVSNALGKAERDFIIRVGNAIALTPPMGWNSWNCWFTNVTQEKVLSSAKALIDKGLTDHGWTYINIDDAWEGEKRDDKGNMVPNSKFPDMKGMSDWLHAQGLKFGIYSAPGPTTCGGYLGSLHHELQDATTFSSWGVDFLKYDWCRGDIQEKSVEDRIEPYRIMTKALRVQNRDIVFSICQYGWEVWKWGSAAGGQTWRITTDIWDNWESVTKGFALEEPGRYTAPGKWNDLDMLIVGNVGFGSPSGENGVLLHPTRITTDEQYTHITLWSLVSSPLLLGCDIASIDDFTLNLLTNDEVLEVNQDPLGKPAHKVIDAGDYQVWTKELEDGSIAAGIFNLTTDLKTLNIDNEIFKGRIRDLWSQKELGKFSGKFTNVVQPHGVVFVKIKN